MPVSAVKKVEVLRTRAKTALDAEALFEAERLALEALTAARSADDFTLMADLVPFLCEARVARRAGALSVRGVKIIDGEMSEEMDVAPGRFLIRPPRVGADARRMRLLALQREVSTLVLCREPRTMSGLCPIVAIAPGTTVRTKIEPPKDIERPSAKWFDEAMIALGVAAIEMAPTDRAAFRRVDALLGGLDAIPDHDELHSALIESCHAAAAEAAA